MNLDKFMGCILGAAIGDALGMPMETMSVNDIQEKIGLITPTFLSPSINPRPFSSLKHLPPGYWTDDTQLTLATMEALTKSGGKFDMGKIAEKHMEEYYWERRGWGKSTKNSCSRLAKGVSWEDSGEPGGVGNGVMMKIAPLGLLQSIKRQSIEVFLKECVAYARMTHLGSQAIVAGVVHAVAIDFLARNYSLFVPGFLSYLHNVAYILEDKLSATGDKIYEQIDRVFAHWQRYADVGKIDLEISSKFGNGTSYAYNSLGLSYALFVSNPKSFDTVWQTALSGGDTDSNASIVGSLYGALNGASHIPEYLLTGLEKREYIEKAVKKFFQACN